MARIDGVNYPGLTFEKNYRGDVKAIKVNLDRCEDFVREFFAQMGVQTEKSPYSKKFLKMMKNGDKEKAEGKYKELDIDELWNDIK